MSISGHSMFVYGTLMFPPVMRAVIGHVPAAQPATLKGFQRFLVRAQWFPGITAAQKEHQVEGLLLCGITTQQLRRLDAYENDFYERIRVKVQTESGRTNEAFTYVIPPCSRTLLTHRAWDPVLFRKHLLKRYLKRFR